MRKLQSRQLSTTDKMVRAKPTYHQEEVILRMEGRNLMTPCFFQVFLNSEDKEWIDLGKTELCLTKTHIFLFSFKFNFVFEKQQQIKVLYRLENEVLTEKLILVSKILRMNQQRMDVRFNPSEKLKISKSNQPVVALKLELGQVGHNKGPLCSLKSEKISGFDGIWHEEDVSMARLSGGDKEKILDFSFWSCNWVLGDSLIGTIKLQVSDLIELKPKQCFEIRDENKREVGEVWYSRIKYERKPSFLDYIVNGLDLKLMLAIDFSNCEKKSLESGNDDIPQLIENIVEFVMEYDDEKEKTYPLFGLGTNFLKLNNGKCKYDMDDKREPQDKRDQDDNEIEQVKAFFNIVNTLNPPYPSSLSLSPLFNEVEEYLNQELSSASASASSSSFVPLSSSIQLPSSFIPSSSVLLPHPPSSKLTYYLLVIIIEHPIEDAKKILEKINYLTSEFPLTIKFISIGKTNLEYLKSKDRKINIVEGWGVGREEGGAKDEGVRKEEGSGREEEDFAKIRRNVFRNVNKAVVDYFYGEKIIPAVTVNKNIKLNE